MISPGYGAIASSNNIGIDSDAELYITNAAISSGTEQSAIRWVVPTLKTNSIWSLLSAAWPFLGSTTATCRWNLKDPRDVNAAYRLTYVNASATSAGLIFSGGYADTFLIPSSILALEDHHIAYYSGTNNTPSGYDCIEFGSVSGTNRLVVAGRNKGTNSSNPEQAIGAANGTILAVNDTSGFGFFGTGRRSGVTQLVRGGSVVATATADGTLPTNSLWLGTVKVSGSPYTPGYSPQRYQWASVGASLSAAQWATYKEIVEEFQSRLGR